MKNDRIRFSRFLMFFLYLSVCCVIPDLSYAELMIDTVAGNGSGGYAGDAGRAISATLNSPKGVAVDHAGNIYIADAVNNRIRKIDTAGVITTLVSSGLNNPMDVATDMNGNIYIADNGNQCIQKADAAGKLTKVMTGLNYPRSVAVDGSGNIYAADTLGNRIRKAGTDGTVTTVTTNVKNPNGLTVDGSGNIFVADTDNKRILKMNSAGTVSKTVTLSFSPTNVAVDEASENLYIADGGSHRIWKCSLKETDCVPVTIAGTGSEGYSGDGEAAAAAKLKSPRDVAVDGEGNVFIADSSNHRIRKIYDNSLKPVAPVLSLTLSPIPSSTMTQVNLSWTDISNETAFWIIRQEPSGGQETWLGSVGTDVLSYTEAIAQDKSCYYKVKAYSGGLYSDYSNRAAVNLKISGDLNGDEKVGLEDAIYSMQVAAGIRSSQLLWQERLEKQFDIVETFDNLKDWYGTKYSSGVGDVVADSFPDDFPKKTDGTPSMWCYYSNWSNPPAVKKPWISNFGSATHFKTEGKTALIDLSSTDGPCRLGTYFGTGESTSGYKDLYLFYMVKISRKQWPTRCESGGTEVTCSSAGTGIYEDGKDYGYWGSWKFNNIGIGWNSCQKWNGSVPDHDHRYGSIEINPHIKVNNYGPIPRLDGKAGQLQNLVLMLQYSAHEGGPTQNTSKIFGGEDTDITFPSEGTAITNFGWEAKGCAIITDEWMGIEFHYTLEEPAGAGNGKMEAWIYNKNGESLPSFYVEGINYLPTSQSGHRFNKFFFGGNNSNAYSWGPTMQAPYYVDDFILDSKRIGPRYFGLDLSDAVYALKVVAGLIP